MNFEDYPGAWDELVATFGRDAVASGSLEKYAEEVRTKKGTVQVDDAFLGEIEGWRVLLAEDIARHNSLSARDLNFAVQQTIDRIVFLRICEDRGIEEYGRLRSLLTGLKTYEGLRQLFWLVSAFTVGHSVSLALSATGVVQLPSAPVELVIALSLLWLALRVLDRRQHLAEPAPSVRRAALVCAAFGLLHGLGFASAFAETGASGDALPLALLGFNVGVELGQLAIVVPAALLLGLLRKRDTQQQWQPRVMWAGAYVIGIASAYFALDRAPGVLAELLVALG